MLTRIIAPLIAMTLAAPTWADMSVTFRDGAPKDTFVISNEGTCALNRVSVLIDLSPSPAGLIFDVTANGDGVEVFQPFEITQGADMLDAVSTITDGDQSVQLDLSGLDAGASLQFTTDLDDTIGAREITVSGSEIAGARVILGDESETVEGVFDDSGVARVTLSDCVS